MLCLLSAGGRRHARHLCHRENGKAESEQCYDIYPDHRGQSTVGQNVTHGTAQDSQTGIISMILMESLREYRSPGHHQHGGETKDGNEAEVSPELLRLSHSRHVSPVILGAGLLSRQFGRLERIVHGDVDRGRLAVVRAPLRHLGRRVSGLVASRMTEGQQTPARRRARCQRSHVAGETSRSLRKLCKRTLMQEKVDQKRCTKCLAHQTRPSEWCSCRAWARPDATRSLHKA